MNEDDVISIKEKKSLLSQLDIELTERCNNNCIHCYINLPENDIEAKKKELSTEELKLILKEAASLGCLNVRFTGGEPLLREDFEDIYVFTRRLGIKVLIFTNARKITPRLADLLTHIPPLEKLEVTLYGMRKESYETVTRVPGSFEEAWRGVNLLLEKKIPFIVKNTLLPPNKKEIEDFKRWAAAIPWMERAPYYSVMIDFHAHRNREKNKIIHRLRNTPAEILEHYSRNKEEYVEEMRKFCTTFASPQGTGLFTCGAGKDSGCLDAYGRFQLCLTLRHPETTYDLKSGTLKDALLNFFPGVRDLRALNGEYLERCARCFLKTLCEQCPAKSWMEHGTLDTPVEYFCEITHKQARFAGILKDGERAWEVKDWKERIKNFSNKKQRKETSMEIHLEKTYVPSDQVVMREIEGELIIVPLTSGIGDLEEELFTLNETGKAILNKLDGKKSLRKVIEELTADFEAQPDTIEEDVIGLVEELLKRKILVEAT